MLVLTVSCSPFILLFAQQQEPDTSKQSQRLSFAEVVKEDFQQWDSNGDGSLSLDEIVAALSNPKVRGESAAAIVAIEKVVRGGKYGLPALTKDYLISSPISERTETGQDGDSKDDDSKAQRFNYPPAFQPRYASALRKLSETSRELFPQALPSFEATHQGAIGDCPFVSTVGAMVYRDAFAVKGMFKQNDNGVTVVRLGNGRSIKIAHLTDSDIAMWSSAGSNGLWLTILEKAYRRIRLETEGPEKQTRSNIYEKFASAHTIEILDGHETRKIHVHAIEASSPQMAALREDLSAALREHLLVKASTLGGKTIPAITPEHAYAVLGYNEETDLVLVWNPHGNNFTPKGPDGLQYGYTTTTGLFKVPLREMPRIFNEATFETKANHQIVRSEK